MPQEPQEPRAVAFVDGQDLFHAARESFGYLYPNYDVLCLARTVCMRQGWRLGEVHFYTGVPSAEDNPYWHRFWRRKLQVMQEAGVKVHTRPLRYRAPRRSGPPGQGAEGPRGNGARRTLPGQGKGIDIRIALDIVRLAREKAYDVALIFSQDQALTEVATELRHIAAEQQRWLKIASAYPCGAESRNRRGIDRTDWIRIERALYDRCLDPRDYRQPDHEGTPAHLADLQLPSGRQPY